jgi:hypothetical protein
MAQSNGGFKIQSWTTKQMGWACGVSLAVGAVVTYQAGFNWVGSWETGEQVDEKLAVSTCVREFLLQPDRGDIHATLIGMDSSYQRRRVLPDHKLAADSSVADGCSDEIGTLDATLFPAA